MRPTDSPVPEPQAADLTEGFLAILPVVERHARVVFRGRPAAEREEATAEAVAAAYVSFVVLQARGRQPHTFPTRLALYAVLRVKDGRHVGGRSSTLDALAPKAQWRRGFHVGPLPTAADDTRRRPGAPEECLCDDTRTPVPDQVAFRLDFPRFLRTLRRRDRRMARLLARGWRAVAVARRFGVSPARVAQLRRRWLLAWRAFHGEPEVTSRRPALASP